MKDALIAIAIAAMVAASTYGLACYIWPDKDTSIETPLSEVVNDPVFKPVKSEYAKSSNDVP